MSAADRDRDALAQRYLRESPGVMAVLEAAGKARLPDWRLFSGAVYQTIWNGLTGRPANHGIRDYDVAYFDTDLTREAETRHQVELLAHVPDPMRGCIEAINQARVHLWFEEKFGRPYAALTCTDGALRQSLFTAHAVGVRLEPDDSLVIAAPYGLGDIFDMVLRPNPEIAAVGAHAVKARQALERWPELVVI